LRFRKVVRENKTAEIEMEVDGCVIRRITITGDFFVYPEEAIELLESGLSGCGDLDCIAKAFQEAKKSIAIGISWEKLEEEVVEALKNICALQTKQNS